jgi:hypothetical protein
VQPRALFCRQSTEILANPARETDFRVDGPAASCYSIK